MVYKTRPPRPHQTSCDHPDWARHGLTDLSLTALASTCHGPCRSGYWHHISDTRSLHVRTQKWIKPSCQKTSSTLLTATHFNSWIMHHLLMLACKTVQNPRKHYKLSTQNPALISKEVSLFWKQAWGIAVQDMDLCCPRHHSPAWKQFNELLQWPSKRKAWARHFKPIRWVVTAEWGISITDLRCYWETFLALGFGEASSLSIHSKRFYLSHKDTEVGNKWLWRQLKITQNVLT